MLLWGERYQVELFNLGVVYYQTYNIHRLYGIRTGECKECY